MCEFDITFQEGCIGGGLQGGFFTVDERLA
jgi:hypothetical protein